MRIQMILILHMLLPVILSPKSPDRAIVQTTDSVPAPVIRAVILDFGVMYTIVMPLEIFQRKKLFVAFFDFAGRV